MFPTRLYFTRATASLTPTSCFFYSGVTGIEKKPLTFFLLSLAPTPGEWLIFFIFKPGCIIFVLFLQSGISWTIVPPLTLTVVTISM